MAKCRIQGEPMEADRMMEQDPDGRQETQAGQRWDLSAGFDELFHSFFL